MSLQTLVSVLIDFLIRLFKAFLLLFGFGFISMSSPSPKKNIRIKDIHNLVFQGGSVKGVAYVGALGALEKCFADNKLSLSKQITQVGGTSAGAITALLLALNYSMKDIIYHLVHTDVRTFLEDKASRVAPNNLLNAEDQSRLTQTQMLAGALLDINEKFGLYSGDKALEWLESLVKARTGLDHCTFREFNDLILNDKGGVKGFRKLYVVGFNLTSNNTQVFSYETTPDTVISDAIRISMSIPVVFLPHNNYIKSKPDLKREVANPDLWVDGGLTNNYPVRIFDVDGIYNENTLGFYFVSPDEIEFFDKRIKNHEACCGVRREIKNGLDFARALLESVIDSQQRATHVDSRDPERTVYINHLNVSTLNFGLTVDEKQALVNSGWQAVCTKFGLTGEKYVCKISIQDQMDEKDAADAAAAAEKAALIKDKCIVV